MIQLKPCWTLSRKIRFPDTFEHFFFFNLKLTRKFSKILVEDLSKTHQPIPHSLEKHVNGQSKWTALWSWGWAHISEHHDQDTTLTLRKVRHVWLLGAVFMLLLACLRIMESGKRIWFLVICEGIFCILLIYAPLFLWQRGVFMIGFKFLTWPSFFLAIHPWSQPSFNMH